MDMIYFDSSIEQLRGIFNNIEESKNRLREIYTISEELWHANLDRFNNKEVKYILLAEAPPWSLDGEPRYFYSKIESLCHKRIWKIFFYDTQIPANGGDTAYEMIADKGFLLIDTVPVSWKYPSNNRRHDSYLKVIENSISWWMSKLSEQQLNISKK